MLTTNKVPEDTFDVRHQLVPKGVGILFILLLILTLYWKKKPEIKAASYYC